MLWIELLIFLAVIILGSRLGGESMGTIAGLGLIIFIFFFRMPVGSPPVIVLGMILAVITALLTMEAAGGMGYLVGVAESIMSKRPQRITLVAPLVTYVFAKEAQATGKGILELVREINYSQKNRSEKFFHQESNWS